MNDDEADTKESRLSSFGHVPSSPSKVVEGVAEMKKNIHQELESLSQPCLIEFQCSLLLTGHPQGNTTDKSQKNLTPTQMFQGGDAMKRARLSDEEGPASKVSNGGAASSSGRRDKSKRKERSKKKGGASVRDITESAVSESRSEQLLVELEWISGDDREMLNQILQYLRNKCQNVNF